MQIVQSDRQDASYGTCTLSGIGVQWREVAYEMATFTCFSKVLEEHLETN